MTIAVTGATGTIGSALVRLLAERGANVRALTRRPGRRDALNGVDWLAADLAERDRLPEALAGSSTLFLLTANSEDMVRLQKNAIRAAVSAGIRTVVKLSALGASDHSRSIIGLWHHAVERELRESGLAWTMLRPHSFMQNFLDPLVFDRHESRVYSASGEGAVPFVDTRDVAAVAATVLTEPGHEGHTYTLTGPAAISHREATATIARVIDRDVTYRPQTYDEAWARRRTLDEAPWIVAAHLALASYQRTGGPTEKTTDSIERITGRPATSFEQFARDHADVLRS